MRRAFSMMMAVVVMVIMMGISAMVFSLSNKIIASTSTQFQKEQAILLAKSYTEFAILAVTAHDINVSGNCVENIKGKIEGITIPNTPTTPSGDVDSGMGYKVEAKISYIGNNLSACTTTLNASNINTLSSPNIIIDIYVMYKNSNFHKNGDSPWMTYHRRTLQKI
ncbi:MAG: type II secretion system protein [Campylobacterota bacterium]|nr:type II secretion system protein [Campylobacterota bacterium]